MTSQESPLVCIVEDDTSMREALSVLLCTTGFEVLAYPSAEEFLAEMNCSRPHCLLADVRLPGMDGIALYRHLVSLGTDPTVLIITGHGDVPMAVAALKEGVVDFVEKPFDAAILLDSLREASRRAIASHHSKIATAETRQRILALSPRERDILELLIGGNPNKVVAATLGISVRTVEHHRAHIMEKMQARSLSHLVRMALAINH